MAIYIIKATPGLTTTESILELLREHPEGMTVKEISQALNRPVSMVNICLKALYSSGQIYTQPDGIQWVVYAVKGERVNS